MIWLSKGFGIRHEVFTAQTEDICAKNHRITLGTQVAR
jgi:hypothetical protein